MHCRTYAFSCMKKQPQLTSLMERLHFLSYCSFDLQGTALIGEQPSPPLLGELPSPALLFSSFSGSFQRACQLQQGQLCQAPSSALHRGAPRNAAIRKSRRGSSFGGCKGATSFGNSSPAVGAEQWNPWTHKAGQELNVSGVSQRLLWAGGGRLQNRLTLRSGEKNSPSLIPWLRKLHKPKGLS